MSHECMTQAILNGLKFLRLGAAIRPPLLMVRVKNGKPSCVHWFVIEQDKPHAVLSWRVAGSRKIKTRGIGRDQIFSRA